MKRIIYISSVLLLWINISLSQQTDSSQLDFLQKAPPNIREYYRVFDSLANPTWQKWVYESWSDDELKKYGSMIYDAVEYNAIRKSIIDHLRYKVTNDANRGWVVKPHHVITELEKRLPLRYHPLLRERTYWLTIKVNDINSTPYLLDSLYTCYWTKKNILGEISDVWKGRMFSIGDSVTCFYMKEWGYRSLIVGKKYLVALYVLKNYEGNSYSFALGGIDGVQKSVFPIEGENIIDSNNIFGLGKIVGLKTFIDSLTSTINEIKSWRNLAH